MKAGRELDALVAIEVMGARKITGDETQKEYEMLRGRWFPAYSTDIAAAWEVVERIETMLPKEGGFSFYGARAEWYVEIDSNDGRFLQNGPAVQAFGRGDSLAHAICLAALRAYGVEV